MAVTDPNSDNAPDVASDVVASDAETSKTEDAQVSASEEATLPAAPALNREQRRAQAKGKKSAAPGFNPLNATNPRFSSGRPANAPIQNKIPRTGHK